MANQNEFKKLNKPRGLLLNKNTSDTHYVPTSASCCRRAESFHFTVAFIFTSAITHTRIPSVLLLKCYGFNI